MAVTASFVLNRAKSITGTYLMGGAGPTFWDCSGFVGYCVGYEYGYHGMFTGDEQFKLADLGFRNVTDSVNLGSGAGMKPGDVLIYNKPGTSGAGADGHTEIYYGDGWTIGARGPQGTAVGTLALVGRVRWQVCRRPKGGVALIRWDSDQ